MQTRTMPVTRILVEWDHDGERWRATHAGQVADLAAGVALRPEPWRRWTPDLILATMGSGRSDQIDETYLTLGSRLPDDQVRAHGADGTDKPVTILGGLWMCEWSARDQVLTVSRGLEQVQVPHCHSRPRRPPTGEAPTGQNRSAEP